MGDYLEATVKKCVVSHSPTPTSTTLTLGCNSPSQDVQFELPIALRLQPGNIIRFYLGCIRGLVNPKITHSDYHSADVFSEGSRRKTEGTLIIRLEAADMKLLEQVKRDYRKQ